MKYVCERCGEQLGVDMDIDDDTTVARALRRHHEGECPGQFLNEGMAAAPQSPAPGWK